MIILAIPQSQFNDILEREKALRDSSPEHTLDWYTYDNRIRLLEEVRDLAPKFTAPSQELVNSLKAESVKPKKKSKPQFTKIEGVDDEGAAEVGKED